MMDLATLEHVNRQATRRAAADKRVPLIIEKADVEAAKAGDMSGVRVPYVGYRTPRGWRRVNLAADGRWFRDTELYHGHLRDENVLFVDKSGFGAAGEPALTLDEFLNVIRPGYGYAVVEEGQFRVKVGVFKRIR